MPEIVEKCPCGAEFRFKGMLCPTGLGDAIVDFRNRHATCRGKRVASPPSTHARANRDRLEAMTRAARDRFKPEDFTTAPPRADGNET